MTFCDLEFLILNIPNLDNFNENGLETLRLAMFSLRYNLTPSCTMFGYFSTIIIEGSKLHMIKAL